MHAGNKCVSCRVGTVWLNCYQTCGLLWRLGLLPQTEGSVTVCKYVMLCGWQMRRTADQTTLVQWIMTETISTVSARRPMAATVRLLSFTCWTRLHTAHRPVTPTTSMHPGLQLLGYFSATPACSGPFQTICIAPFSFRSLSAARIFWFILNAKLTVVYCCCYLHLSTRLPTHQPDVC